MLNEQESLKSIRHGVFSALHAWGLHDNVNFFDDLIQNAYTYWYAHESEDNDYNLEQEKVYCFNAARIATKKFLSLRTRQWKAEQKCERYYYSSHLSNNKRKFEQPELVEELKSILYAQRKKGGHRGKTAADQEVRIIQMVVEGYNDDGIGMELNLKPDTIRHYRNIIRRRLEQHISTLA